MIVKENRALGRKTLLKSHELDNRDRNSHKLPHLSVQLPQLEQSNLLTSACEGPGGVQQKTFFRKEALMTNSGGYSPLKVRLQTRELILYDLCEGMRVTILGQKPTDMRRGDVFRDPMLHRVALGMPSPDQIHKVYWAYQDLLALEQTLQIQEEQESGSEDEFEDHLGDADGLQDHGILLPVKWDTIFKWAENHIVFAKDHVAKTVCQSFSQSLKNYRLTLAAKAGIRQRMGVSISMMLQ